MFPLAVVLIARCAKWRRENPPGRCHHLVPRKWECGTVSNNRLTRHRATAGLPCKADVEQCACNSAAARFEPALQGIHPLLTVLTQLDCLFAVVGDSWGGSGYPRSLLRPAAAEPHHCEARAARSWYMRGRLTERGGGIRTHVSSVSEVDEVGRGDREMRSV